MPSYTEIIEWLVTPEVSTTIAIGLVSYFLLLWLALIIWATKDIISRTNNIPFQIISIFLVVFLNIFGLIIYIAVRPSKTLIEKFFEDLEYEALVQETRKEKPKNKQKPAKAKKTTKKPRKKS
ncbi:hypothetical protein ACFL3C_03510 [Patescibacteria group bacterium]